MAYFHQHPYYNSSAPRRGSPNPFGYPFATGHGPALGNGTTTTPHPTFNFFNGNTPGAPVFPGHYLSDEDLFNPFERSAPAPAPRRESPHVHEDLDEEERAALAHLRAIQQRKKDQEVALARERAARAEASAAREAAIRRAIAAEVEAQRKREKEEEIARIRAQAAARLREQAILEALRSEQIRREQAARVQAQAQAQAERQRRYAEIKAAQRARFEAAIKEIAECAKRCAAQYARQAAREQVKNHGNELQQLNGILGSLFGIQLVEDNEEQENEVKEKVEEKPKVPEVKVSPPTEPTQEAQPKSEETSAQPAFPEHINDILSQFLGLRVEPPSKSSTEQPSAHSGIPEGLNELLGQFGLVFEPEEPSTTNQAPTAGPSESTKPSAPVTSVAPAPTVEKPAEASSSKVSPTQPRSFSKEEYVPKTAPSIEETPLTAFLNGVADLPPFVRDILGNVEMAWKQQNQQQDSQESEVQGKGKGVDRSTWGTASAPAPTSTPSVPSVPSVPVASTPADSTTTPSVSSSTASLDKLSSIDHEIDLVRDSFTFPSRLTFGPSPSSDAAPNLLFNKTNSQYHAQANKLLQLLLAADGVSSDGDREVRHKRKEVVKKVEKEISLLEEKRDQAWEEVRARRESGEISDDEEETVSTGSTSSVVDHEEVREEPIGRVEDVENVDKVEEEEVKAEEIKESNDSEPVVEGFEVPTHVEETPAPQTTESQAADEVSETAEIKEKEKLAVKEELKEDNKAKEDKHDDEYEFIE